MASKIKEFKLIGGIRLESGLLIKKYRKILCRSAAWFCIAGSDKPQKFNHLKLASLVGIIPDRTIGFVSLIKIFPTFFGFELVMWDGNVHKQITILSIISHWQPAAMAKAEYHNRKCHSRAHDSTYYYLLFYGLILFVSPYEFYFCNVFFCF